MVRLKIGGCIILLQHLTFSEALALYCSTLLTQKKALALYCSTLLTQTLAVTKMKAQVNPSASFTALRCSISVS